MFLLTALTILSFTFGFVFPPFWILTFVCGRQIIKIGRARHAEAYDAEQRAREKMFLSWSK